MINQNSLFMVRSRYWLILVLSVLLSAEVSAINLKEIYSARAHPAVMKKGLTWECGRTDVYKLSSFKYQVGDDFLIECGKTDLAVGHHEGLAVWLALFPETGSITQASNGAGENIRSIWIRFHPDLLNTLIPPETVVDMAGSQVSAKARRVANLKVSGSWQSGGLPQIPSMDSLVFDIDTVENTRRFYTVDTTAGTVEYFAAFEQRALSPPIPLSAEEALAGFDKVWEEFDRVYPLFTIRPKVDWKALREKHRRAAEKVKDNYGLALVLADLLKPLRDLHIYVMVGSEYVPVYNRPRPINANWAGVKSRLSAVKNPDRSIAWGKASDQIGYIAVFNLMNQQTPAMFGNALDELRETDGLIVDLRFNGGGGELIAREMAGRFLDKPRVYSKNQYRSGPTHEDLGEVLERTFEPAGPWIYQKPALCLQGQKTMSSAESFALMMAQCPLVLTAGDQTAGSSANPTRVEIAGDIVVNLPRWLDLRPDGKPLDEIGSEPDVKIPSRPEDFTGDQDPVFAAALKMIKEKVAGPNGGVPSNITFPEFDQPAPAQIAAAAGANLPAHLMAPQGEDDLGPLSPPRVINMTPVNGSVNVDPNTDKIQVFFNRSMSGGRSITGGGDSFPQISGDIQWLADRKALIIPVKLQPNKTYKFGLNSMSHHNFRSVEGIPLPWKRVSFTTGAGDGTPPRLGPVPEQPDGVTPRVISLDPPPGALDVDPDLKEIRVVFDQRMSGGFSWTGAGPNHPKASGSPRWMPDQRTCVMPVELKPNWDYSFGLNSPSHKNFKSERGAPLPWHRFSFRTASGVKSRRERRTAILPKVVSVTPEDGAEGVDPNLKEIRVVFDRPMGGGMSWTGGGPTMPQSAGKAYWLDDKKTCVLPVKLKPNWDYAFGLNSPANQNFRSETGVPLDWRRFSFSTGPGGGE